MEKHIDFVKRIIRTSPFYNRFYVSDELFLGEELVFERLPLTKKKQIQQFGWHDDIFKSSDKNIISLETSGTTGIPMKIFWSKKEYTCSNIYIWKLRLKWYNITPDMKYCTFHSCVSVKDEIQKINVLVTNQGRTLSLGRYIYSDERLANYIDMIEAFETQWILGPASVLCLLSKYMLDNNLKLEKIRYIELNGEFVDHTMIDTIKNAFPQANISNLYGSTEFNGMAFTCPFGKMHVLKNNVYLETIYENGFPAIYVTGLVNTVMPLIRYQIGDVGIIEHDSCPCGCTGPFLKLQKGRLSELLRLKNNLYFDPSSFNSVMFDINRSELIISQFQINVNSETEVEIVVLVNKKYFESTQLAHKIIRECNRLNDRIHYRVRFVCNEAQIYNDPQKFSFVKYKI